MTSLLVVLLFASVGDCTQSPTNGGGAIIPRSDWIFSILQSSTLLNPFVHITGEID